MKNLVLAIEDKSYVWRYEGPDDAGDAEEGLRISVEALFYETPSERDAERWLQQLLKEIGCDWLGRTASGWYLDIAKAIEAFKDNADAVAALSWMSGVVRVHFRLGYQSVRTIRHLYEGVPIKIEIFKEDYMRERNTMIFLSHKGVDKPMVHRFHDVLALLGFAPWLDDEMMPAGTKLHRGIKEGFEDSCAAVFFITPSFRDEGVIAKEIDYAIHEETKKGDQFSIIALVFRDENGNQGVVPKLLEPYVWKHPTTELDALYEIIRALPIKVGPIEWKK